MVGLVLVSHSRKLADALLTLIRQVAPAEVPIALAAGVGPDRQEFGTDALEISEAIQSVYSPDGVLVLMDLGSAILSAQTALELLPEEMHPNVRFCSAPLVEGAIAAGVQSSLGSDLETVCREARQALSPKREQIGDLPEEPLPERIPLPEVHTTDHRTVLTLKNEHGLHARPAARFVRTASQFDAEVQVKNLTTGKGPVAAKSLNALATLGALKGHRIELLASGPQAKSALSALRKLVEDNFGEVAPAPPPEAAPPLAVVSQADGAIQGLPVAEGIALGPSAPLAAPVPAVPTHRIDDPDQAWSRLLEAIDKVKTEIRGRRKDFFERLGEAHASIFDAHLLILQDPELLSKTRKKILTQKMNAAAAWHAGIQEVIAAYRALDDPYLRQRAADVADVGDQVLRALAGDAPLKLEFSHPVILIAEDLTPTQTAQLDLEQVMGLVTVLGGPTSHSAILARALGIPAMTAAPPSVLQLEAGTLLALDGSSGTLWVSPSDETQAKLQAERKKWLETRRQLVEASRQPAVTLDGHAIEVAANVGGLPDAHAAVKNGAEAIGLLRTEFLFLTRNTAPGEEEQYHTLAQIAALMGNRPIIIRTLDAGGDKPLAYLEQPAEANPFLGVRGVRLSLQHPDLFRTQLRAILRAGAGHRFRIMFPMVADLDEFLRAREILNDVHQALETEGVAHAWPVETGIMIEVPSAALLADLFAAHVDFFSVGTNDLTQYTLAAERGNPALSGFADGLHPAVLRLIHRTVEAAERHGKWVGVCGELAGDPLAAPVLIGLGVKELSLNPAGIPRIKAAVRSITFAAARRLARQVLAAPSAAQARQLAGDFRKH